MTTVGLPDNFTYTTTELVSCLVEPSACAYGSEGWGFESLRARHLSAETLKAPIATRPSVDTFRHHFPRRRTDRGIPARQARRSGLALQIVRFCGREFRVAELSLGRGRGRTTVYGGAPNDLTCAFVGTAPLVQRDSRSSQRLRWLSVDGGGLSADQLPTERRSPWASS